MKLFFALTVLLFAFAMNTIQIDRAPGDHSGHVAANAQLVGSR